MDLLFDRDAHIRYIIDTGCDVDPKRIRPVFMGGANMGKMRMFLLPQV